MTTAQWLAAAPYLILAAFSIMLTLLIPFRRSHSLTACLASSGLALSTISLIFASNTAPQNFTMLLSIDSVSLYFAGLINLAAIAACLLTFNYPPARGMERREELYLLYLLAALGASVLAASAHFASLFLALELLTVPLYAMIAFTRDDAERIEAGIKYLILASVSSAFLLFGMALIYAGTGTMDLDRLAESIAGGMADESLIIFAGLAMMLIGVGFKLALVPFHLWTPDIYQGAMPPVAAFVATVSKGGMFAVLLRYFTPLEPGKSPSLHLAFVATSIASMFVGNWLALLQTNVKRILAYSSIAHLGYLMVAVVSIDDIALAAGLFYITAYMASILIAFGVVCALSTTQKDAEDIACYQGLFWTRPWLAGLFAIALMSLAGIPLTGGFVGKFYLVAAGARSAEWLLLLSLAVSSSIGLFYYLRIAAAMLSQADEQSTFSAPFQHRWPASVTIGVLGFILLWMGLTPSSLATLIDSIV